MTASLTNVLDQALKRLDPNFSVREGSNQTYTLAGSEFELRSRVRNCLKQAGLLQVKVVKNRAPEGNLSLRVTPAPKGLSSPRHKIERLVGIDLSTLHQEKKITPEQATAQIHSILWDYTHPDGLIASLAQFISITTGMAPIDVAIMKITYDLGWSGDQTYSVVDRRTGEWIYVLKTYPQSKDTKTYLDEIFSLTFLKKLNLKNTSQPKIYALGRCNDLFLLCEGVASGRSLRQYCFDVAKHPQVLDSLLKGAYRTGQSIATLHQYKAGKAAPLQQWVLDSFDKDYQNTLAKLEANPVEGIDIEQLKKYVTDQLAQIAKETFPTGITHGGFKLSHTFYNSETDEFTLIDPPSLVRSLDGDRTIGVPAIEYYKFLFSIQFKRVYIGLNENHEITITELLTLPESERMIASFTEGYKQAGGQIPTPAQLSFFELHGLLYGIGSAPPSLDCRGITDPVEIDKRTWFAYRVPWCHKDLKARLYKNSVSN